MKIGFLLGLPDITGGTYVIYEHGTRLLDLGHDVSIITEEPVSAARYRWHPRASALRWLSLAEAAKERFDIILPTWWQSVFQLSRVHAGHYVYFVQSIESRFIKAEDPLDSDLRNMGLVRDYRESSYTIDIPVITEAEWIRNYLYENYNRNAYLVRNGIRKDLYRCDGPAVEPRVRGRLRALVEGPVDVHYKNVPKSIALCRQAGIEEIWLLTSSDVQSVDGVDRLFSRVGIEQTPAIYRSCDVLVKLSSIEGMFGPPLEMFHCGGTAIVYAVTGHDEYIVHNKNSYVVDQDQDHEVVACLQKLQQDPDELDRLKAGGAETAASWPDWSEAAREFDRALRDISSRPYTSKTYVDKWLDRLVADNGRRFQQREIERFRARERAPVPGDDDRHNFIQVYYWAEEQGLSPSGFEGAYFKSGEPVEITVTITVSGFPFWIRVDPSVRMGVIMLDSIKVVDRNSGTVRYSCESPEQFNALYAAGTIRRIGRTDRAAYLSTGDDPQLILPALTTGTVGERLDVTIRLEECGVGEYLEVPDRDPSSALAAPGILQRVKRMLKRVGGSR